MPVDYNRQYVGARYVPTFFNNPNGSWDWATGFQYEPLTIVKYGTGTYTSKQLVPATVGAPNTAPEYWALTGDYNGAITQLQGQVSENTNDIAMLKKRRILIIGDSYIQSYPNNNWASLIKTAVESNGGICNIVAQGGSGFVGNGTVPNFQELLESAPNAEYDTILVQGFVNDMPGGVLAPSFTNNVTLFRRKAFQLYPNSKIICLPISKVMTNHNVGIIHTMYNAVTNNNMVFYMPAWGVLYDSSQMQSDNTHPNGTGQNNIFKLALSLLTGTPNYSFYTNNEDASIYVSCDIATCYLKIGTLVERAQTAGGDFGDNINIGNISLVNPAYNFFINSFIRDTSNLHLFLARIQQSNFNVYVNIIPVSTNETGSIANYTFSSSTSAQISAPVERIIKG